MKHKLTSVYPFACSFKVSLAIELGVNTDLEQDIFALLW